MFIINYKRLQQKLASLLKDRYFVVIFILFLIGTFLRFYRLPEFMIFLGDQGRDAIIIRRILTLEHLPAIGPPTSVGQVYLGPFYYYFIAPWLLLFNFDPVGLAVGVAFFSSLFILITYLIVEELFDKNKAILTTIFITFSAVLVDLSRYSWNPNLLPLFSLLTVYFLIKAFRTKKRRFFLLTGALLSFIIQLHYLSLFLIPALVILILLLITEKKDTFKRYLSHILSLIASFCFFSSPLIIFDLRHGFLNTKNFIDFFKTETNQGSNKLANFFESFRLLNQFSFNIEITLLIAVVIGMLIIGYLAYWIIKRKNNWHWAGIFLTAAGFFSFYGGSQYPHYFGFIYPIYYIIIADFLLSFLNVKRPIAFIILTIFVVTFITLQSQSYQFLYTPGSNQINSAKKIAQKIYDNTDGAGRYRLTSLPERYGDYTYRYFLDLWGRKPVEKDSIERTNTLLVICEKSCKPIGDPSWDVAFFAPIKIINQWKVAGVTIYKLIN